MFVNTYSNKIVNEIHNIILNNGWYEGSEEPAKIPAPDEYEYMGYCSRQVSQMHQQERSLSQESTYELLDCVRNFLPYAIREWEENGDNGRFLSIRDMLSELDKRMLDATDELMLAWVEGYVQKDCCHYSDPVCKHWQELTEEVVSVRRREIYSAAHS